MNKFIKNKKIQILFFFILSLLILYIIKVSYDKSKKNLPLYETHEETEDKKDKTLPDEETPKEEVIRPITSPAPEIKPVEYISNDFEYAKYWKDIYEEYPWYGKLPIEKEEYRLLWVLEEKSFRIRLKISENSPQEQKNKLINQALEDIQELTGESYKNYPYYVLYTED